jgi:hypothetical protein
MIKGSAGTGTKNQPQEGLIRLSDLYNMHAETGDYPSGSSSSGSPEQKDMVDSYPPNQYQQFPMLELDYGHSGMCIVYIIRHSCRKNALVDIYSDSFWCDSSFAQCGEHPYVTCFEEFPLYQKFM